MGTTGLISRANDEAFYKLRGRGGSFPGLELKKMEISLEKETTFLLQLVQNPDRLE